MSELYNRIEQLCSANGITITQLCRGSGASRGSLTDLKMGRKQSLSADTLTKIAGYLEVSVDYLLGKEEQKEAPAKRQKLSDEDIKFALFNRDKEISDEAYEEVKAFAEFVRQKYKKGK